MQLLNLFVLKCDRKAGSALADHSKPDLLSVFLRVHCPDQYCFQRFPIALQTGTIKRISRYSGLNFTEVLNLPYSIDAEITGIKKVDGFLASFEEELTEEEAAAIVAA